MLVAISAIQHNLKVFTAQTVFTYPLILVSWHGFQAGTFKVVPSITTITGNPVLVHMKVVACSAYIVIL